MSNVAIRVEGLSKLYALGQIGTGTISRDIERWWTMRVRGKQDPFLKIGQTNDRTVKAESEFVWSLKDVDFEVQKGDVVGIIGRNGAGKSTLLKILSKITSPTTGKIQINGRIASLLEVGTGFHPEMTGKENVFMNGAILGMRKKEIERKFDEIVDFAGVAAYVDTPVKRYSSGMTVRLGFAVAAFLDPEILIVDEVLAVGDAEFQKKCIGRMKDASQQEGRTVLFVSHNLGSVRQLCTKGMVMENGLLKLQGSVVDCINAYTSSKIQTAFDDEGGAVRILEFKLFTEDAAISDSIAHDKDFFIKIVLTSSEQVKNAILSLTIIDVSEAPVATLHIKPVNLHTNGNIEFVIRVKGGSLAPNNLKWTLVIHDKYQVFKKMADVYPFKIFDNGTEFVEWESVDYGKLLLKYEIV